ncbi:putative LmbE-like protein [Nostoc sp. PCC 7524]|nr:putative LmbE-like protein [Nostoc sp. PCC 7524]
MKNKKNVSKFRYFLGTQLRLLNTNILYYWILYFRSQPLAVSHKSAIVFAPHQDDETLGCGGLIALKRSLGIPVEVVFMTDGRYGISHGFTSEKITDIRQEEAVNALNILGITDLHIHFLNQIDGSLQNLPHHQRQQIIDQLVQLLHSFKPEEVYVPHRKDVHNDHEATYSLVKEAIAVSGLHVDLLQYPVWFFWQNPLSLKIKLADITNAYRLAIGSVKERKKQAIVSYNSQLPILPSPFLKRFFLPYEIFFK